LVRSCFTYQSGAAAFYRNNKQTPTNNGEKYNGYQRIVYAGDYASRIYRALLAIEVGVTLWNR